MPAPKNPSHQGSGGYPYLTEDQIPKLAVEEDEPEAIAQADEQFQDEAQSGQHPNDFGTGHSFGFASENYPHEKHVSNRSYFALLCDGISWDWQIEVADTAGGRAV